MHYGEDSPNDIRFPPPNDLPKESRQLWRKIVLTMPTAWFSPENLPMLRAYCWHVQEHKRLCDMVDEASKNIDGDNLKRYRMLAVLRQTESQVIVKLATAMRFTQQSAESSPKSQKNKTIDVEKPWQD